MRLGRRAVLAAAAASLAGCAPDVGSRRDLETTRGESDTHRSAPASPTPATSSRVVSSPAPAPTSAAPLADLPTRDAVLAEFSQQAPTQWGLEVEGVVLRSEAPSVCLTFDACGGPNGSGFDDELIQALVDTATPATLFLNSRWIEANPQTTRDLLANPLFELANHGTRHVPLSVTGREAYGIPGTASVGEVYDEVVENQVKMASLLGTPPRFFRSGTAHFDEVAAEIVRHLGLLPVNFDVNADAGATFTASQVRTATAVAGQGAICLGHFNRPGSGTADGVRAAIADLQGGGTTFTRLGDVLT